MSIFEADKEFIQALYAAFIPPAAEGATSAWRREYPTRPGYYWIRNHKGSHDRDVVEVFKNAYDELRVFFLGDDNSYGLSELGTPEWQGPILPTEFIEGLGYQCAKCARAFSPDKFEGNTCPQCR